MVRLIKNCRIRLPSRVRIETHRGYARWRGAGCRIRLPSRVRIETAGSVGGADTLRRSHPASKPGED